MVELIAIAWGSHVINDVYIRTYRSFRSCTLTADPCYRRACDPQTRGYLYERRCKYSSIDPLTDPTNQALLYPWVYAQDKRQSDQ